MKLLIQPRDGIAPLIAAIKKARKSIELVIFRFDRDEHRAGSATPPSDGAFRSMRSSLIPIRAGQGDCGSSSSAYSGPAQRWTGPGTTSSGITASS